MGKNHEKSFCSCRRDVAAYAAVGLVAAVGVTIGLDLTALAGVVSVRGELATNHPHSRGTPAVAAVVVADVIDSAWRGASLEAQAPWMIKLVLPTRVSPPFDRQFHSTFHVDLVHFDGYLAP